MAKNLANLMTAILKRANVDVEQRKTIKAVLDNADIAGIEIDEDDYTEVLSNLHNLETAEAELKPKIAKTVKAEYLNGVDAMILEILGEGMEDSELDLIKGEKQTAPKLRKSVEILKSKLKTATKNGDVDLEKTLRAEITKLTKEFKDAQTKFEEEKQGIIANHKKQLFEKDLTSRLKSRTDIAEEFKTQRHFAENFKADLNSFLNEGGIEIDFETNEVLNKDSKTPYLTKTKDKTDFDWVIASVIDKYDYKKKSEPAPQGVIADPSQVQGFDLNAAIQRTKALNGM